MNDSMNESFHTDTSSRINPIVIRINSYFCFSPGILTTFLTIIKPSNTSEFLVQIIFQKLLRSSRHDYLRFISFQFNNDSSYIISFAEKSEGICFSFGKIIIPFIINQNNSWTHMVHFSSVNITY
jgi:hypothetical protein